jgi:hypothetical protein
VIVTSISISDSAKGFFAALAGRLRGFERAYVSIGVHEGAGHYENGPEVAEVALWNEYGTAPRANHPGTPERSFIRSTIDENDALINSWREEAITKILTGEWGPKKALEAIGFRVQVLIQNKIRSNVPPPNAPSTVEQKRRDGVPPNTLINSGLLLRSVTYRVVNA